MAVIRDVLIWDAERTDAERGDIVIDAGGTISEITEPGTAPGEVMIDGRGRAIALPGLVNSHTHVSMTLLRGLGEELPLMDWLRNKIFPVEDRLRAEHIRAGADLAMLEMIAGGVTCLADMYYFMNEVALAVLGSGMRAALSRGLTGENAQKLRENLDLADEFNGREGRLIVQLGPHAPYTVPRRAIENIAHTAAEKNLGIHFHWLETKGELDSFRAENGIDPVEYLEQTGLLDVRELILAHGVWFPHDGLSSAARGNVTIVHNPKSNLKLGSGHAPVRQMLESGVNVALGTDGAASNNRLDMWDEMRTAALMHKGYHLDPTLISARQVLKMATVNGASGIGFKDVGLIRKGYKADIILIDMSGPRYVGCNRTNVPEFLVYAGSSRDVSATIVAGKILYKDGEYMTLDKDEIISRASKYREEIDKIDVK
ncbi:MAG: amidohydrolase [Synergistaceae bacterium]|jgi:5-methylthioadenosine/S-adenosylhomocysteine deaminase|nr:amidohydrolase [Synergistaceae bacterium]